MSTRAVRVVDPRLEPQPEPVYADTIAPKQNQYYSLPASGISDSYITYNNITTLGADRAYQDTFAQRLTARVTLHKRGTGGGTAITTNLYDILTFDSFPFAKCCEQARVNINGGAFFSEPMTYIRAKERYWDEEKLVESYGNTCPCIKPRISNELGLRSLTGLSQIPVANNRALNMAVPSRMGYGQKDRCFTSEGTSNNDMLESIVWINGDGTSSPMDIDNLRLTFGSADEDVTFEVTWLEPIFASPFSSRFDNTYGRALYNITSMDITFNLQDLGNMIRLYAGNMVTGYSVHLTAASLVYQVLTVPPELSVPPSTIVPYRRFVPYVTNVTPGDEFTGRTTGGAYGYNVRATSGVYTLNEVPTAIWIFLGPTKALLQQNLKDGISYTDTASTPVTLNLDSWCWNKLAFPLDRINITMANTTQILNTATREDLYRIAKANGCQDSYASWSRNYMLNGSDIYASLPNAKTTYQQVTSGAGSFLRLIPGVDIVLPEQKLVPGANASNAVFQVEAFFRIPENTPDTYFPSKTSPTIALWILFEYVGVATISPGQCIIDMNPLKSGAAAASAPVVSTTPSEPASTTEGSGWLDVLKDVASKAHNFAKKNKLISKGLAMVPGVGGVLSSAANAMGYGYKRPRLTGGSVTGGAVMGMGDFI